MSVRNKRLMALVAIIVFFVSLLPVYAEPSDGGFINYCGEGGSGENIPRGELLEIQPRMLYVYDAFGYKDMELTGTKPALADEQAQILAAPPYSDDPYLPPINSSAASNANTWRTPGANWNNNTTAAVLNLLRSCRINEIWFYDGPVYAPSTYTADGSAPYEVMEGTFKIYNGEEELVSYPVTNNGMWVRVSLGTEGIETNMLRFVKEQDLVNNRYSWSGGGWTSAPGQYVCDVNIPEVALYGESLGEIPPEPPVNEWPGLTPSEEEPTDFDFTLGEFMGTNGFFNDVLGNYGAVGFVREYHHWGWTEWAAGDQAASDGTKNYTGVDANPQTAFIDPWGGVFDNYYKSLKEMGVGVNICVQGGVSNVPAGMTPRPNYQGDTDKYKASSYLAHGQSMFQLAARYGSNPEVDPDLIRVAPGTQPKIGLDYIRYYENWNEPNLGSFRGDGAAFAAMTSADYDGHMGTMGPDVGVKQADPNARFVLGGLAGIIYDTMDTPDKEWTFRAFLEQMIEWFDNNRTEEQWLETHDTLEGYVKYPFDVLNGHYYSPDGYATTGLSPEADHVYRRMSEFKAFRDTYFPNVELWLSEFGWDSTQGSPQSATVTSTINAGLTGKEVQGRWLVREYLLLAAAGLDRVQQFMMPNSGGGEGSSGRFDTCGLIEGSQTSSNRKPSWYYVGTTKYYLETTKFDGILANGGETDPWVLKFNETAENGTDSIYALWLPTSEGDLNGTNVENYQLTLPEGTEYAYLVKLKDKTLQGERTELEIADGKVTVPVTESPVFVLANTEEFYKPVVGGILPVAVNKLTTANTDPRLLFDRGLTDTGTSIDNSNGWNPGGLNRYALIDLGAEYVVTGAYVWDQNGSLTSGKVFAVYAGDPGGWVPAYGSESPARVMSELAENWERIGYDTFMDYGKWVNTLKTGPTQTRYLIVGFEDGPETGNTDVWATDTIAVPEMVLQGYIARGQTPPDPSERTYEAKPSETEYRFIFDEDFDSLASGTFTPADNSYYAYAGGSTITVEDKNSDPEKGKVLKIDATGSSTEFGLQNALVDDLEEGVWYYVDYKLKIADEASKPVLQLVLNGSDYRPIYNTQTAPHTFKPIWGGSSQATTVSPNIWHHLKTKFRIDPATKYISYEVYYDDALLGAATIDNSPASAPITKIIVATNNGGVGRSTIYLDDIWFYTKIVKPKIDAANFTLYGLLNENWSWLGTPSNAFDEQRTPVGAPVATRGTPQGSDPANGVPQGGPLPLYQYSEFGVPVDRPVLLDLGEVYDITDIYLMTKNNAQTNTPFQIWYGPGFPTLPLQQFMTAAAVQSELAANWTLAYSQVLSAANGYPNNNWIPNPPHFDTPIRTRYVILEARGVNGNTQSTGIQEIVFYGTGADGTTPPRDYTVSFDVNYRVNPEDMTVNEGNSVTLPLPTREGYTFDGWYDSAVGGTLMGTAGSEYCPDGNITLYAHWTKLP